MNGIGVTCLRFTRKLAVTTSPRSLKIARGMGHALSEPPRGNLGADSEYRRELGVSIVQDAPWTVSATLCYREHELGFSYACEICVARCTMRGDIVLHYPRLYNGTYETHVGMPAWFGSWITWLALVVWLAHCWVYSCA
ncbi:hypothetical protein ACOSQ2_003158 [Xanthoceras sorbifolium]